MFRCLVLCTFLGFSTILSIAQALGDRVTSTPRGNAVPAANRESPITTEARVSVVRLKEPNKVRRLYQSALKAWLKRRTDKAQSNLDQALKLYPAFPEALTLYAGIHASVQRWSLAEKEVHAAVEIDPTYSPAYVVLAGIYNAQGRFDEAESASQQAVSAGAHCWDLQYEIARAFIGKGQYESALVVAEARLHAKDHGSLLHLAKAHALLGLRRYPQAIAELRSFVHYKPDGDGSEHARELLNRIQAVAGE